MSDTTNDPVPPQGVTLVRGAMFYHVEGISTGSGLDLRLPADTQSLTRLRDLCNWLLWKAERGEAILNHSRLVLCSAVALSALLLLPVASYAQRRHRAVARPLGRAQSPARSPLTPAQIAVGVLARQHPVLYLLWQLAQAQRAAELQRAKSKGQGGAGNASPLAPGSLPILRTARDRLYRTKLREAAMQPANFNHHYVLAYWGCGTECVEGAAIDKSTGRVTWLPSLICCWLSQSDSPLDFNLSSNLVRTHGAILVKSQGRKNGPEVVMRGQHAWRLVRGRWR